MLYSQAKQTVHSRGTVPDGYFGHRRSVEFGYDAESGKTLIITETGFFNAGLPDAKDKAESLWLLKNHPTARKITVTSAIN